MNEATVPMAPWLEQAWLQRYLDRELTPAETEWFEVYVLDKPALLDRIDRDSDLRDALAAGSQGNVAPIARPARPRWREVHPFAQAAAVVASLGIGWWAATALGPEAGGTSGPVMVDPTRVVFDTQRDGNAEPLVFNAGSSSGYVMVEVGVPPDAADLELHLGTQPPRALARTSEGFSTFLLPRSAIGDSTASIRYRSRGQAVVRELDLAPVLKGDSP